MMRRFSAPFLQELLDQVWMARSEVSDFSRVFSKIVEFLTTTCGILILWWRDG